MSYRCCFQVQMGSCKTWASTRRRKIMAYCLSFWHTHTHTLHIGEKKTHIPIPHETNMLSAFSWHDFFSAVIVYLVVLLNKLAYWHVENNLDNDVTHLIENWQIKIFAWEWRRTSTYLIGLKMARLPGAFELSDFWNIFFEPVSGQLKKTHVRDNVKLIFALKKLLFSSRLFSHRASNQNLNASTRAHSQTTLHVTVMQLWQIK